MLLCFFIALFATYVQSKWLKCFLHLQWVALAQPLQIHCIQLFTSIWSFWLSHDPQNDNQLVSKSIQGSSKTYKFLISKTFEISVITDVFLINSNNGMSNKLGSLLNVWTAESAVFWGSCNSPPSHHASLSLHLLLLPDLRDCCQISGILRLFAEVWGSVRHHSWSVDQTLSSRSHWTQCSSWSMWDQKVRLKE